MADTVRINGIQHSWSSVKLTIDDEVFTGVTSIGFADQLGVAQAYGMGKHHAPLGQSAGKYSAEPLKLRMRKSSAQTLREQLAQRSSSGSAYGRVVFAVVLQYLEEDDTAMTVEFEGCRYVKTTDANEESPDPLTEEVEISVQRIRRNGLTLFDESRS